MKGRITSYEQLAELVERAKTEPVRVYVVWNPSEWAGASGTITRKSTVRNGLKTIKCFDVQDFDESEIVSHCEFEFEINQTKGFYRHNRYFTNYWHAYAYYLRM